MASLSIWVKVMSLRCFDAKNGDAEVRVMVFCLQPAARCASIFGENKAHKDQRSRVEVLVVF